MSYQDIITEHDTPSGKIYTYGWYVKDEQGERGRVVTSASKPDDPHARHLVEVDFKKSNA